MRTITTYRKSGRLFILRVIACLRTVALVSAPFFGRGNGKLGSQLNLCGTPDRTAVEPAASLAPQSDALGMNEPAPRNSLLVRNQFHIDYCTVRVTVPSALVLPDVPVTVTV